MSPLPASSGRRFERFPSCRQTVPALRGKADTAEVAFDHRFARDQPLEAQGTSELVALLPVRQRQTGWADDDVSGAGEAA
jgi:hypothetical protein